MFNSYINRFNKMFESINSDTIKTYARLGESNSFIRKRKMPLADTILYTLSKKRIDYSYGTAPIFRSKRSRPHEYIKTGVFTTT